MRPTLVVRIAIAIALGLLVLATRTAAAQSAPKPGGVRMFERFTVTAPPSWKAGPTTKTSVELYVPRTPGRPGIVEGEKNDKPGYLFPADAGMLVTQETRRDHAEALRRLAEIASEQPEKATTAVISGWPAIERRYRSRMPQPGESAGAGNVETWYSTVAVAAGNRLIRFETTLAPDVDPKLLDEADAIARSFVAPGGNRATAERELPEVTRQIRTPPGEPGGGGEPQPGPGDKPSHGGTGGKGPGAAILVHAGRGELEVAASNDGLHVVVAANSGFSFSDNSGGTWSAVAPTPCTLAVCDGDPSLAVGQSGAIYYSWIGGASAAALGDGISRSIDNGHTFPFRGQPVTCPGASACSVADQEHIAADRANAGGMGDRVYNVWRNFPTAGAFSIRIVCSQDGGATWGAQQVLGAGDLPRVSVGGDGFVYASWSSGGNMMISKFSNCDAGLAVQAGFPVVAAPFTNVVCPVPGLDRCNGRNILSSNVVAVDDVDPNHVYFGFATSTGAGNEDVMVFDSNDGGLTFPRSVRVNAAAVGRRFMPWISSYGGVAAVAWYDRRTATAMNNDRTRFFIGSVALKGTHLLAGPEVDLSGVDDAHCASWPCATNATPDSEGCAAQPQLAGGCSAPGTLAPSGSVPCDFSSGPACPAGLTCNVGRGCPKFGDYNGNAATAGRHFSGWASGTPPTGVVGAPAGINVYTSTDLIPSDFFVRDWTNSATDHDRGQQPSTNPTFWATSDVWNQSTNVATAFPASDWIVGDPGNRSGSNFAFARVSRRAAAATTAPNVDVTVDFMQADYGLGTMFTSAGTEVVTFGAGDMTKVTPGHAWTVGATASNHLCLAAQISAPNDDFDPPSLTTTAPGPANAMIVNDNNKAQRNLADTIGSGSGFSEIIARIRNSFVRPRLMDLQIRWPIPRSLPATVEVIGGPRVDLQRFKGRASIRLGELKPGEDRWVRFRVKTTSARPVTVDFFDADGEGKSQKATNGFSVRVMHDEPLEVAARNLRLFGDMLLRMAELEKNDEARQEGESARNAARETGFSTSGYVAYMKAHRAGVERVVTKHLESAGKDPFGAGAAWKQLVAGITAGNASAVESAQNALTERLEAHLTAALRAANP